MFNYDEEAQAAYYLIEPDAVVTRTIDMGSVLLDFDRELRLVGVEFLFPPQKLLDVFSTDETSVKEGDR